MIILAALLVVRPFEQGGKTTRGRQLCDNSFCLRLPAGWAGRTEAGGTAGRLVAAPFKLPSWVGEHKGRNHRDPRKAICDPRDQLRSRLFVRMAANQDARCFAARLAGRARLGDWRSILRKDQRDLPWSFRCLAGDGRRCLAGNRGERCAMKGCEDPVHRCELVVRRLRICKLH